MQIQIGSKNKFTSSHSILDKETGLFMVFESTS